MNALRPVLASTFALFAALAAGCSTAATSDEPVSETEAAATSQCSAADYNAALAHYKNAVEGSKERLRDGVCATERGYQWLIADEASRAVTLCGDFRATIKTSPWAAPLRTVLADSLTLKSLTGELLVIKDSEYQSWVGVDAMLVGQHFWARSAGAYGPSREITFAADGKATFRFLSYDEKTGDIYPVDEAATYTIAKPNGERGKRTITVSHGGLTESYVLGVEAGYEPNDAPIFTLTPTTESDDPNGGRKLYSLVDECDA